jgi:hypothetical protein
MNEKDTVALPIEEKLEIIKKLILKLSIPTHPDYPTILVHMPAFFRMVFTPTSEENETLFGTANIKFNPKIKKYEITLFEKFVNKLSIYELLCVIFHEIDHFLLGDLEITREDYSKINPLVYNLVLDQRINRVYVGNKKFRNIKAPEGIFYVKELDKLNLSTHQLYNFIIENSKIYEFPNFPNLVFIVINISGVKITSELEDIFNNEAQMINNDLLNGLEIEEIAKKIQNNDGFIKRIFVNDYSPSGSGEGDGIPSEDEIYESSIIKNETENALKMIGDSTGDIIDLIKEAILPKINPFEIFEKAIRNHIQLTQDNQSWARLNTKLRPLGINMPGPDYEESKPSVLYFYIDSSGSMSKNELQKALGVLIQMIPFFEKILVKCHDTEPEPEFTVLTKETTVDTLNIKKRGGTSHYLVFEDVLNHATENDVDISLIILFTDGYSDFESLKNHDLLKIAPIKVLLTENTKIPKEIDEFPIFIK